MPARSASVATASSVRSGTFRGALPKRQGLFLSSGHMEPRAAVREALERGQRAALVTVTGLDGDPPAREGMALGVLESGASLGTLGCDGFHPAGATDASRALRARHRTERTSEPDD